MYQNAGSTSEPKPVGTEEEVIPPAEDFTASEYLATFKESKGTKTTVASKDFHVS